VVLFIAVSHPARNIMYAVMGMALAAGFIGGRVGLWIAVKSPA
jgi:hypothetical protein